MDITSVPATAGLTSIAPLSNPIIISDLHLTERKPKTRTTEITADEFYVAVLSNEAKVVLAKFMA